MNYKNIINLLYNELKETDNQIDALYNSNLSL